MARRSEAAEVTFFGYTPRELWCLWFHPEIPNDFPLDQPWLCVYCGLEWPAEVEPIVAEESPEVTSAISMALRAGDKYALAEWLGKTKTQREED